MGIGIKGAESGPLAFLFRFLPKEFLISVSLIVVLTYKYGAANTLKYCAYGLLITIATIGLLSGSKAFLIGLLIPLFLLILFKYRNLAN